jgi:DTW domain-containing protein YfiP
LGRRNLLHERCQVCWLRLDDCVCGFAPPQSLRTEVALVTHRRELSKPTNTGRLALLALTRSRLLVRGHQEDPADLTSLVAAERRTWLLFPRDDARALTAADVQADPRPITLVVPDGTWAQARRAVRREPVLASIPAFLPPDGPATRYGLRREHVDGGLSTFEAIVRALTVIEGPAVGAELQRWFDAAVGRQHARRPPVRERVAGR